MPNYNFSKDLPIAKKTEEEVASIVEKKYGYKVVEFNNDNRYDFKVAKADNFITFEVKEDFTCERTGNVGLEFQCRGKDSGINVSQADFYIYKLHTPAYGIMYVMLTTKRLKELVAENKYFRIVNGGDVNSNSMNYLFKLDVFLKNGTIIAREK